jgi:uncharacterized protein YjbI with pentapeptide repeats
MTQKELQKKLDAHVVWLKDRRPRSSCFDLGNTQVARLNVPGADLSYTCFRNKCLEDSNFEGCVFEGTEFDHANLRGVNMRRANLNCADLSSTILQSANLSGAVLDRAQLTLADLSGANLEGANLDTAVLIHLVISETTNLKGTCLDPGNKPNGDVAEFQRDPNNPDFIIG